MNLREARKYAMLNFKAGNAMILKGPPGFGKTDIASTLFADLKAAYPDKKVGMGICFIATKEGVDAPGLPWKGSLTVDGKTYTTTDHAMPSWYMSTEGKPASEYDMFFLVLEEWGQGQAEAKRAFAEILRIGGTPPWFLPEGSPRLALSNIDKSDGVTKEFDFIIGRRNEITVSGDVDVWIEDFANKPYKWQGKVWQVMGITKAFAKARPDVFFEPKPKVQGPWCNPRSATQWDRMAQCAAEANNGEIPHKDDGFLENSVGYIGSPAVTALGTFLQFQLELPTYEDVIKDPDGTPVPDKVDLKLLMAYELSFRAKKPDLPAIVTYARRFHKDMAMTFAKSLLQREPRWITEKPIQDWVAKNVSLINTLHSLSGAK